MPSLNATFAFKEVQSISVFICKHLYFYMPRGTNIFFYKNRTISKSRFSFADSPFHLIFEVFLFFNNPHAFTSTSGRSFDQYRKAYFFCNSRSFLNICNGFVHTWNHRDPVIFHSILGGKFTTHDPYGVRTRPDPGNTVILYGFSKTGVFT